MKKLGVVLGLLVVLFLAGLAIGPSLINWNQHKPGIEARLSDTLGRKVRIEGDLSLTLLPAPAFAADEVTIANIPGATTPTMASLRSLRARVAVLPLVQGEVQVDSLELIEPVVALEILPDGRRNWRFDKAEAVSRTEIPLPGQPAPDTAARRGAMPSIRLDNVAITAGQVHLLRPGKPPLGLEDVTAKVSADSLKGPLKATGTASPIALAVQLKLPRQGAEMRLSGQILNGAETPGFRGKLNVSAVHAGRLAAALGRGGILPEGLSGVFALEGAVTAGTGEASLNEMRLRVGDTEGGGTLSARLDGQRPRLGARLAFNRLNLDELLGAGTVEAAPAAAPPAETPTAEPAPAAPALTLPEGFDANLDLAADALVWRGGLIQQARVNAILENGEVMVNQASAQLPGGSDVNLFGYIHLAEGRPVVDGAFDAASDNLRSLLDWLKIDLHAVPADRLRKFSASGKLKGAPADLQLSGLDMRLDTARLNGAATLRFGERLAVGANLVVDNLNVDAYRIRADKPEAAPAQPPQPQPQPDQTPAAQPAAQPEDKAGLPALGRFDANFKARIEQATWNGVAVQDVRLDATLLRGTLTLREAALGDVGGAALSLTGAVAAIDRVPELRHLAYDLRSRQPGKFFRLLGWHPDFTDRLSALALTGTIDGNAGAVVVESRAESGGAILSLAGTVTQPFTKARHVDLKVAGAHGGMAEFVRLFSPHYRPQAALGAFDLAARVQGDGRRLAVSDLRLRAGPASLAGEARLTLDGAKPRLDAVLTGNEIVVDSFLPAKRQAAAAPDVVPAFYGEGEVQLAAATSTADERWSQEPLDLDWLNGFDAEVKLTAPALTYEQYRLDNAALTLLVADGAMALQPLTGTLFGGGLNLRGGLGADGQASLLLDVAGAQIRQALLKAAAMDIASGTLATNMRLNSVGHTVHDLIARLDGQAKLEVHDGAVNGFDLQAVNQRLNNIDNPASLLSLVQAGLTGGQTRFSALTGTFKVDNGVVMTRDLALQAEGGTAQAVATVNLPAYTIDSRTEFRLAEHPGAPPLVLRLQGSLENPRKVFDINALQSWLVERGVGRLLKGKGGDVGRILEGVLGGQAAPAAEGQAPAQPADPQRIKPKDVLQGILKGLQQPRQ